MLQLVPAARVAPQVVVSEKAAAFTPLTVMPVMVSGALPALERATVCVALVVLMIWLPKLTGVGARLACGAVPVPVRVTVWGVPVALSATESVALWAPAAVGAKATVMAQLPPAASDDPQALVCVNAAALAPVRVTPVIESVALPGLESMTVCVALVVLMD
jgi:hypothetical protein